MLPPISANFYPRSPCGERRVTVLGIQHKVGISIHALLAESDALIRYLINTYHNFYPRSPCGERPVCAVARSPASRFLSTLSLRRATPAKSESLTTYLISIHALLAESDYLGAGKSYNVRDFYPRSPCGERPIRVEIFGVLCPFLSTLSLRRATTQWRL